MFCQLPFTIKCIFLEFLHSLKSLSMNYCTLIITWKVPKYAKQHQKERRRSTNTTLTWPINTGPQARNSAGRQTQIWPGNSKARTGDNFKNVCCPPPTHTHTLAIKCWGISWKQFWHTKSTCPDLWVRPPPNNQKGPWSAKDQCFYDVWGSRVHWKLILLAGNHLYTGTV
jgi:hypothetical protein